MNLNYYRVIDANLNRSREGLRVIEDTARFVLEKDSLYKKIRSLRHELDIVTRSVYPKLLEKRDSNGDVGRKIKEGRRQDVTSVLAANFRRVEESLRVLEEYSRFLKPSAGKIFKKVRYEVYSVEKILVKVDSMLDPRY
jgi:thiamine-phosphate pyrophosphorylase